MGQNYRLTFCCQRLDELANNCTVSCLVVYATICATYLFFYKT
jgi:amino acid transporter